MSYIDYGFTVAVCVALSLLLQHSIHSIYYVASRRRVRPRTVHTPQKLATLIGWVGCPRYWLTFVMAIYTSVVEPSSTTILNTTRVARCNIDGIGWSSSLFHAWLPLHCAT